MAYVCKTTGNLAFFSRESWNNKALNIITVCGIALQFLALLCPPLRTLLKLSPVGAGDIVNEVYIIIKNSEEEKCFIAYEKTWPAIEFFYEGASETIRVGNKVLVYFDEAEERNPIVSIEDNRTREQEMEIIKKQLGNIVWTIILSMAGVDIALVLFFLCLYKLINFDGSGEQKENKVVLIVMTVFFAFASVAMTTSKVIRTNLTETAIETTQQIHMHGGE